MKFSLSLSKVYRRSGIALPLVLIVVAALLILSLGMMSVTHVERGTSRLYADQQRADLAASAGLEDVCAILRKETANDDFYIIQHLERQQTHSAQAPPPYLYLARGSGGEKSGGRLTNLNYHYTPLFSTEILPKDSQLLRAPDPEQLTSAERKSITARPWWDAASVSWIPIKNSSGKVVSRYAYWVEDLQGTLNPTVAGNRLGPGGSHLRAEYPAPPSQPLSQKSSPANAIALHALDPDSGDVPSGKLSQTLIANRDLMLTPESVLAATGLDESVSLATLLKRNLCPVIQPYDEQPLVPFAPGISELASGKPKLNLNQLLNQPRAEAVDRFAEWVRTALPDFEQRQGGFPEDYLKTLAANAFDYADTDREPTVKSGSYRGLDAYPMLSEVVLKIEYLDHHAKDGRLWLDWRFQLFGEFWNMTNQPVSGDASLSYEVRLKPSTIVPKGIEGKAFDDPLILLDPARSTHSLKQRGKRFYTPEVKVELQPDEYRFYKFAEVTYATEVGPNSISYNSNFNLEEDATDPRGISVIWNSVETERTEKLDRSENPMVMRGKFEVKYLSFNIFYTGTTIGKAAMPGTRYGFEKNFANNMGDPRMSHYFRNLPLSENPLNDISPNRRNIRLETVYQKDTPAKRNPNGRVLPSEWPDGGHDSDTGVFKPLVVEDFPGTPLDKKYQNRPKPRRGNAPQRLSNAGRFFSVAELGNTYDPVMWRPTVAHSEKDTERLNAPDLLAASLPAGLGGWPAVEAFSPSSRDHGGGNTLRIGRPEHPAFDVPGKHAAHLLDLFHVGNPHTATELNAVEATVSINGQVNLNTAEKDVLRALAAGLLAQDPELQRVTDRQHSTTGGQNHPQTERHSLGSPTREHAADLIAEGILRSRPFASHQQLAWIRDAAGQPLFGNPQLHPNGERIQWSDAAAEEIFTRVADASTLRSRNFRVWVVAQSLSGSGKSLHVTSEVRKCSTVFADPGPRDADGRLDASKVNVRVLFENQF